MHMKRFPPLPTTFLLTPFADSYCTTTFLFYKKTHSFPSVKMKVVALFAVLPALAVLAEPAAFPDPTPAAPALQFGKPAVERAANIDARQGRFRGHCYTLSVS